MKSHTIDYERAAHFQQMASYYSRQAIANIGVTNKRAVTVRDYWVNRAEYFYRMARVTMGIEE